MGNLPLISFIFFFSIIIPVANGVITRSLTPRRGAAGEMAREFAELSTNSRESTSRRPSRVNILDDDYVEPSLGVRRYSAGSSSRTLKVMTEFKLLGQIWPEDDYIIYLDTSKFDMDDQKRIIGHDEPDVLKTASDGSFSWKFLVKHNESDEDIAVDVHMHIFGTVPNENLHRNIVIAEANLAKVHIWDLVENQIISRHPRFVEHELEDLKERDENRRRRSRIRGRRKSVYKFKVHIWPKAVYELFLDVNEFKMDPKKRIFGTANPFDTVTDAAGSFVWEFEIEMDDFEKAPTHVYMHIFDRKGTHYEKKIRVDDWDNHYIVDLATNDVQDVLKQNLDLEFLKLRDSVASGETKELTFYGRVWPEGKYKLFWDVKGFEMDEAQRLIKSELNVPHDCFTDENGKFKLEYEIENKSREVARWRLPPVHLYIFGASVWTKEYVHVTDWHHVHIFDLKNGKKYALPADKVAEKLYELSKRDQMNERTNEITFTRSFCPFRQ
uniref:Esophageal gland-localized secretory protein 15 n=1 Tax=Heterodera glycines TaxID=51029 RepID=A0A0E3JCD3_HETGL|nr:esophageal gland-localized secretory protein 15 [Heterodera glycines]